VGIGHALLSKTWVNNPWTNKYKQENQSGIIQRNAGWLSGACLLVRRSAFEQINGFSRDYFMYFEDVDLGFRLGRHGFRNVYAPSAVVVHVGAHSTENEPAAMIAAHHESAERFLMNRYSGPWLAPLRLAIGIGLKTRSLWTQSRVSRSAGR
jgi:N-acetylglucosaminyl-diphospho-decaprenol L-rhamnosyltransferase